MNHREALIARLTHVDDGIASLLDTYAGGAAIFSPIKPDDYEWKTLPGCLIRRPTGFDDVSPFQGAESLILVTMVFYAKLADNSTDDGPVAAAAQAAWSLFRHSSFVGADGIRYQATASGPVAAPTSTPRLVGELIQLRLRCGG